MASPDERWLEVLADARRRSAPSVGDFVALEERARGGQGVVYRARRRSTGEVVALKRLQRGLLASNAALERVEREVAAVATLVALQQFSPFRASPAPPPCAPAPTHAWPFAHPSP
jgi:hypothetical protein